MTSTRESDRQERSDAFRDLGGQSSGPLTPDQESALYDGGLGSKTMRRRVELRRDAARRAEERALRNSPEYRATSARGREKVFRALFGAMDDGVDEKELGRRRTMRIARGYIEPPIKSDVALPTESKPEPSYRSSGSEPQTLFDTLPKSVGPVVEFIKVPEGPSVDLEDRAQALEPFMKAGGVLSAYNVVGHAEDGYAKNPSSDLGKPDRVHGGLRDKADKAMRDAQPQIGVLVAQDYYKRWGYSPEEIDSYRQEMIEDLRDYGANTTSKERQALLVKVQATAAMAASIKSRK